LSRLKLAIPINSWKDEIKKARLRIKELKIAIEVFDELDKAGEPCPRAQSDAQFSTEEHSG
jgi:hypothetical protein